MLGVNLFCLTPEESLTKLLQGNERYIQDKILHKDPVDMRRQSVVLQQNPFAVILGCSDSRVPPEMIFDQDLGDLFVIRIAGNVITPEVMASIEYATLYLGSNLIFVLGHENCGAVNSVIRGVTRDIEPIAERIVKALKRLGKTTYDLSFYIKTNTQYVADEIKKNAVIKKLLQEKKIDVVGGFYFLESGKVELI